LAGTALGRFCRTNGLGRSASGHAAKRVFQVLCESPPTISSPYGRSDSRNTGRGVGAYALEGAGGGGSACARGAASGEGPHARHAGPTRLHLPERRPALVGEYPRCRPSSNRGGRTYVP